jgi:hypothetical protein
VLNARVGHEARRGAFSEELREVEQVKLPTSEPEQHAEDAGKAKDRQKSS